MKRILSVAAVIAMVVSFFSFGSAAAFAENNFFSALGEAAGGLADSGLDFGSLLSSAIGSVTGESISEDDLSEIKDTLIETIGSVVGTLASESLGIGGTENAEGTGSGYEGETVVDNDDIVFRITGDDPNAVWGYTLKAYCENKTDRNLTFSWNGTAVDGAMCDPMWSLDVPAGKKSNTEITFYTGTFKSINELSFTLCVTDSADDAAEPVLQEKYVLYPTGLDAETFVPEKYDLTGAEVLYDGDDAVFAVLGTEQEDLIGYSVKVYLEDKTDGDLRFSWENVSVNDYMINPEWVRSVSAGKYDVTNIYFWDTDLEANSIENVDEIEFTLEIRDAEDELAEPYAEETYIYTAAK